MGEMLRDRLERESAVLAPRSSPPLATGVRIVEVEPNPSPWERSCPPHMPITAPQLKAILRSWGMPEDNAEITAEVLAW